MIGFSVYIIQGISVNINRKKFLIHIHRNIGHIDNKGILFYIIVHGWVCYKARYI